VGAQGAAAAPAPLTAAVRAYRVANERRILGELTTLLALPNLASDRVGIRRNAALVSEMLARRGLAPRLLEAPGDSTAPVVYGEYRVPGATRTLVFYAHYDGQPADPAQWTGDPWKPVFRTAALDAGGEVVALPPGDAPVDPSWRLYARSASDDKAGVVAILTAFDALRAAGRAPAANLKFFFEGEEEAGSPNLAAILARPPRAARRPTPGSSATGPSTSPGASRWCSACAATATPTSPSTARRAPCTAATTATGRPTRDGARAAARLDDRHHGARARRRLVRRRRRRSARTSGGDRRRTAPDSRPARRPRPRAHRRARAHAGELITEPSLNVNGVRSGDVGAQSRNVIPTTAGAALDLRLVLGNDPERQVAKLRAHVAAQGYHVLDRAPTAAERARHPRVATLVRRPGGYAAERTPMTTPAARAVLAAVQSTVREPVVAVPTLGGSLPLVVFREALGATTITVPIANPDNNQHAENENLRVGALWDGIESLAAVMGTPAPR
jgi:acetylornithine deacetylase/succinyl-diaminopimelate desuccinylase-like protein